MDIKKTDKISGIIQVVSYIILIATCMVLMQPIYSPTKEWEVSFPIIFWANHLLIILDFILRKRSSPFRKLFYLRIPQICSASFGILINTVFILKGEIGESGLIYILPMLWPIYIGLVYYIGVISADVYLVFQARQERKGAKPEDN